MGESLMVPGSHRPLSCPPAPLGHPGPAQQAHILFQQLPRSLGSCSNSWFDFAFSLWFLHLESFFFCTHLNTCLGIRFLGRFAVRFYIAFLCLKWKQGLHEQLHPVRGPEAWPRERVGVLLTLSHPPRTSCFAQKALQSLCALALPSHKALLLFDPCEAPTSFSLTGYVSTQGLRGPDAVCSRTFPFLGSGPPVPAPDLLMQIKQEGELQLQEQQALGVEAWAAGQPDIGEEPWGLSQLDSGAGDISTDAASGEWLRWEQRLGTKCGDSGQGMGERVPGSIVGSCGLSNIWPDSFRSLPTFRQGLHHMTSCSPSGFSDALVQVFLSLTFISCTPVLLAPALGI